MTRTFAVLLVAATTLLVVATTLLGAPRAVADPQDLVPYCSGDQTPMDDNCRPMAHQEFTHGSGFDPDLSSGLDPENAQVIG